MPALPDLTALLPSAKAAVRLAAGTASLAAGGWVLQALRDTPAALGATPAALHAAAEGSPNYRGGIFHNQEPASPIKLDVEENRMLLFEMFASRSNSLPRKDIPLADPTPHGAAGRLSTTWLGHATALVEVDGYRLLTDPVWSERCSPSRAVGPQRLHPPPVPLEALPALDAVVISHDHHDHLDMATVRALARTQRAVFVTPLGVGAHLAAWGIPAARIVQLDWGASHVIDGLTLTCAPARHYSGRFLTRNNTLWASWVFAGPRHRVYFGGDTGYTTGFTEIGSAHGPFDLTLLPIGAYNRSWPDIHMNPEEAVQAHLDLNAAGVLVPIHWGTFRLAPHPWAEPPDRLLESAADAGVEVAVPRPGGRVVPGRAAVEPWWRF